MYNDSHVRMLMLCEDLDVSLSKALKALKKASDWGIIDIFGGGFFTSVIKKSNMSEASKYIHESQLYLQELATLVESNGIDIYNLADFDGLLDFTDVVFDNFLVDLFAQKRIENAYKTVHKIYKSNQALLKRLKSE